MMYKNLYLLVCLTAISIALIILFNVKVPPKVNLSQKLIFEEWKLKFGKNYFSNEEEMYRFGLFQQNRIMVNQHNTLYQKGEVYSQLRLNQFSDLTIEQFKKMYLSQEKQLKSHSLFDCTGPFYPKKTTFDSDFSSNKDMLTPVGTQGQCASGYAFATVAGVQASMYKATNQITQLSVQQLIDCSQRTGNNGCDGGNTMYSLHEFMNRGAMRATDYPFTGKVGTCKYPETENIWVWRVGNCAIGAGDVALLKSQILGQPVMVGFDATDPSFIQLGVGIYTPSKCTTTKINHYMLAVGWGQQTVGTLIKTTNYYIIVKNSFGVAWGNNGYGKVAVQVNQTLTGACGMTNHISFPLE